MFGILDCHHAHYYTGYYFAEYPDLDNLQSGERFKYREQIKSEMMTDVVMNMANQSTQKTIVTTHKIPFKPEGYVLLEENLYRIMDISESMILPQSGLLVKNPRKATTLILNRVSNPLEMKI